MGTQQIRVAKLSAGFWRASFDHPPINLIDHDTVAELAALLTRIEQDPQLRVIVFESADPDFFLAHYDVLAASTPFTQPAGPTGLHPWLDVLVRLSRAPVISIALIRGRARGAGSELALACDLRFASLGRALLGQFEVTVGAVPGGGPMARLARLVGRARALEIVVGGHDFPAELAERYGYVNRALPDDQLDAFVDAFAERLARFDKRAIAEIKSHVDRITLPSDEELSSGLDAFYASVRRPETQARVTALLQVGLQKRSELELDLGEKADTLLSPDA